MTFYRGSCFIFNKYSDSTYTGDPEIYNAQFSLHSLPNYTNSENNTVEDCVKVYCLLHFSIIINLSLAICSSNFK